MDKIKEGLEKLIFGLSTHQLLVTSSHQTGLPDECLDMAAFSFPYYALRDYEGDQAVEWAPMSYSPVPGLSPIEVPGCDPNCAHEWANYVIPPRHGDDGVKGSGLHGAGAGKASQSNTQRKPTTGAWCQKCGGWRGALGQEPDTFMYIGHLILIMREVWRTLKPWGVCFVNLADSYAGSGGAHKPEHANPGLSKSAHRNGLAGHVANKGRDKHKPKGDGHKQKDLFGIPELFVLAAKADGWYYRNNIVWAKGLSYLEEYAGPCMTESMDDRFTRSHEPVFLLSKRPRYYMDMVAVAEEAKTEEGTRNPRTVWVIPPEPYSGAHFAAWPTALVEIMIKAGTSEKGNCPACGKPWMRQVEKYQVPTGRWSKNSGAKRADTPGVELSPTSSMRTGKTNKKRTTGWAPSCTCDAGDPVPAIVADFFSGSGTTGAVAVDLGRRYVGIDINAGYHALAEERIKNYRKPAKKSQPAAYQPLTLFELSE